ncbi:hypothetical protein [Shewanella frigidimarina]|uniref:hypothetical protein n=1 Tax=Shewanella frigidimarina TaxID=56812 RepID=UPI003D79BA81
MSLVKLDIPAPEKLRRGWSALAAVYAARGWDRDVYATPDEWFYHDGGGNWVCLRFRGEGQAILIGHDHEYSETYFGDGATYFQEEETNLLECAPEWWSFNLNPKPFGEWIGFVYGWDGEKWERACYDIQDGFESVGLLEACSFNSTELLKVMASDAPGLNGKAPSEEALDALIAGENVTYDLLEAVVPGWNIEAGVSAANKFT